MSESDETHPFDEATENAHDVNDRLAETDGAICEMSFSGAVGYHVHVATGETSADYLTRTALLQALDDVLFERLGVHDDPDPSDARATVERQLREVLDLAPHTAELVADEYESNLRSLRETQAEAEVSGE